MSTLFEQAIDAFAANIAADATVISDGATVTKARVGAWSESELPAYVLTYGGDAPLNELGPDNTRFIDWEFVIFVDLYDKLTTAAIDSVFQDMRANIHRALMADVTQGVNFILTTIPAGSDEPLIDDQAEQKTLAWRTNWICRLRTSIDDLETI